MNKRGAVFAAATVLLCYLATFGLRAFAGAVPSEGTAGIVLLAVLGFLAAFFALFGFSITLFSLFDKKYLLFAVSAAATFTGGLICGLLTTPFGGFFDSVVAPFVFVAVCFSLAFALSFALKYRPVYFAVSAVGFVFAGILSRNALGEAANAAVGAVFPFVRIYSDIGLDKGIIAYIVYVVIFLLHYIILRKCVGLFSGRKG